MNQDRDQGLQSTVLNRLRRQKMPVTVHLVNGIKLQGTISSFDQFSVLLRRGDRQRLVYKHAITTIEPSQPISIQEGSSDSADRKKKSHREEKSIVSGGPVPTGEKKPDEVLEKEEKTGD